MSQERIPGLLSVTVLNYNYGRYLPACLDSILGQTYRDLEVIVIDDCSKDESLKALEPYRDDPRVRIVAHAQNVGFRGSLIEGTEERSRGEFVSVISADDVIRRSDAFELQMRPHLARRDVAISFGAHDQFFSDTGEVFSVHRSLPATQVLDPPEAFRRILTDKAFWILHSGAVLRRSAYDAVGGYDRDIAFALDNALWMRLCQEGAVAYTDQILYGYRLHRQQMSVNLRTARAIPLELIRSIDRACDRAERRGWELGSLRRDAFRVRVGGHLMQEAFNGRRRQALAAYRSTMGARPAGLLGSGASWLALARALLGARGFGAVRAAVRVVRPRSTAR